MTRFAIRGLLSRKLRTALTAIAIVLGVAMISGTYVLTDSIDQAFDRIFADIRKGSNAVITGKSAFDLSDGSGVDEPTLDEALLPKVRELPAVAEAEGGVDSDATQLIGDDGKAIVFGGAPNLGFSIADPDSPFNPLTLVEGDWPGPNEVMVDKETASKEGFEVGQVIGVQAEGPVERMPISGIMQFSSGLTIGGATLAGFDLATAQQLFGKVGKLDEIAVASQPDTPPTELVAQIQEILPPDAQVKTGDEQAKSDAAETDEFISFLQTFLLAFGGIALFVGSFVIANSLSITIAQRTREFATLRTIGATNRQLLGSILVEALVVGTVASVVGLFLGLLLAKGLFQLFDAVGFTLPNTGLVFEPRTIVVALTAGILVTLLASVYPGFRATTVPPIAAVREGAVLPGEPLDSVRGVRLAALLTVIGVLVGVIAISASPGNTFVTILLAVLGLLMTLFGCALFPSRTLGAVVSCGLGFAALLYGLFVPGLGTTRVLLWMGLGVLLVFFGVARVTTRLIPGLASAMSPVARWSVFLLSVVVWPFFTLPYWLLRRGVWGPGGLAQRIGAFVLGALINPIVLAVVLLMVVRKAVSRWQPEWPAEFPGVVPDGSTAAMGRENSRRNAQRTASTASALMIGLALVTLVATLAAGIVQTFRGAVNDLWKTSDSDYAITAQNNFSPIPVDAADTAAKAPGVVAVMNVRTGEVRAFDETIFATAVDPTARELIAVKWKDGSPDVLANLGEDGAFVDDGYADDNNLEVGSPIEVTFPDGTTETFTVEGIFDPPTGGSPFGNITISTEAWDARVENPRNLYSFIAMEGDVTDDNTATLDDALADFPNAKVQTREQFIDNQISGLNAVLNILYVLLALSVLVSLFGIVNTLVLTVFERTREIGMLRAIGMTRRQVRRMIRHESVITALIGAAIGIALGIVLALLLIARLEFVDFAFPTTQVIVFVIAAIIVGVVAAIFPARRAAKLDPLRAIAYE
ncbi:MAG TPA: FtsX-like permease family protein [Gaiellaceae bacterium]|jgi:ABC-type antimicrobial peptide transport system permease subunit|nr:FtsX-like permease family protein [Gaiellaceae bacterium]